MENINKQDKTELHIKNKKAIVNKKIDSKQILFYVICLAPAFLCFLIFILIPTFDMIINSMYKWNGLTADKLFVGFGNYALIFKSATFWKIFKNTVILIFVPSIFTIILAMISAFLLTNRYVRGKTFFKVVFYFPNILSIVVIAGVFMGILDYNKGILNAILEFINPALKHYWFNEAETVQGVIMFMMVWQAVGYYMVMYIAGMDSIPTSLYECADLEGASSSRQFFSITLPLTWEVVRTTFTFFVISSINLAFMLVKATTDGQPGNESNVLLNYMYRIAYNNGEYGYGMAIGVILFIFTFGLSLIIKLVTKRDVDTV